jgi:hypothetical protein
MRGMNRSTWASMGGPGVAAAGRGAFSVYANAFAPSSSRSARAHAAGETHRIQRRLQQIKSACQKSESAGS